ncbi:MAG: hypothetical protein IPJ89_02050 [Candidatus Iainarchaeum archaeon]|uniref:RNA polymerase sigma factor 54 DNA-binding domain-containing protein n=1 Tax=Candidatus Iainarchaeum sp. TaxID=3101447 RepID=A0A7T9I227_9ARCH|nr:MAG: hypothetical protein IPJ89_02050 [Candidatus Diapherotrites archaeon]
MTKVGLSIRQQVSLSSPSVSPVLFLSQAEMLRFLEDYAKYVVKPHPKGQKTWAALLFARYKIVMEKKSKPYDPMHDSQVHQVTLAPRADPVKIIRHEGRWTTDYLERANRVVDTTLERITDPTQRRKVEPLANHIRKGIEIKQRVLDAALAHQEVFLRTGNVVDIKPILQRELSAQVGLHVSSISRILSGVTLYLGKRRIKAIHLVPGFNFNRVVLTEAIRRIKKNSQKPLSDEMITRIVNERFPEKFVKKGQTLARRTIAKFSGNKKRRRGH